MSSDTMDSVASITSSRSISDFAVMGSKDPDLIRGVSVREVHHCFGRLFKSSSGNPEDYRRSSRVTHIDGFLSHCWLNHWLLKTLATMLYFNGSAAVTIANVAAGFAALGHTYRLVPVLCYEEGGFWTDCPDSHEPNVKAIGIACSVVGWASYMIVLFNGQRLRTMFFMTKRVVFLDKVCIQQCGEHAQLADGCPLCQVKGDGIRALGAFLHKSRKLLILYSNVYLDRLWCCYEFACFLALSDMSDIEILPLELPGILVSLWVISSCVILGYWAEEVISWFTLVAFRILLGMCLFCAIWLLRKWGLERKSILKKTKTFDLRNSKCTVDSDRQLVFRRISRWCRKPKRNLETRTSDFRLSESSCKRSNSSSTTSRFPDAVRAMVGRVSITNSTGSTLNGNPDSTEPELALGIADPDADEDEAIDAFNDFVRNEGAMAMEQQLGVSVLPYRQLVFVLSSFAWGYLDVLSAKIGIHSLTNKAHIIAGIIETISACFIFIPLLISVAANIASWGRRWSTFPSVCYCLFITLGSLVLGLLGQEALTALHDLMSDDLSNIWIIALIDVVALVVLALVQFGWVRIRPWSLLRRAKAKEPTENTNSDGRGRDLQENDQFPPELEDSSPPERPMSVSGQGWRPSWQQEDLAEGTSNDSAESA